MRYPRAESSTPPRRPDLTTRLRAVQSAYADAQHDLDLILLRPTLFDTADLEGRATTRTTVWRFDPAEH